MQAVYRPFPMIVVTPTRPATIPASRPNTLTPTKRQVEMLAAPQRIKLDSTIDEIKRGDVADPDACGSRSFV